MHSGYQNNFRDDIAVLQLDRSAKLNDKVATVCLPDSRPDLNSNCYVTGLTFMLIIHSKCRRNNISPF